MFGSRFMIRASYVVLLILAITGRVHAESSSTMDPLALFQQWFVEKGGWIHPGIQVRKFEDTQFMGGNGLLTDQTLEKGTKILEVPSSLILSANTTLENWETISTWGTENFVKELKALNIYLSTDQIIIASRLLYEDCLGSKSEMAPYLRILPEETPPLLFTYNEEELALLQDNVMTDIALDEIDQLEVIWQEAVHPSVQGLLLGSNITSGRCLSKEAFFRYYAIVLSHNMILDEESYLVPMADQINHGNLPLSSSTEHSFGDFHQWSSSDDGKHSIVVMADRTTQADDQVLEEYSKTDNSLYLCKYGFVPLDNPYHCSLIGSSLLVRQMDAVVHLAFLRLVPESQSGVFCIKPDGEVVGGDSMLRTMTSAYAMKKDSVEKEDCTDAYEKYVQTKGKDDLTEEGKKVLFDDALKACTQGRYNAQDKNDLLSAAAKEVSDSMATTLEADLKRLEMWEEQGDLHTEQSLTALRFRIEEKKVLKALSPNEDVL